MDVSQKGGENNLPISQAAGQVAALVHGWRCEVPKQWGPGKLKINQDELRGILETWKAAGLDPKMLACAVLGSEWLFRARKANDQDVERELVKIQRGMSNRLRGGMGPEQAGLILEVLPALRKNLSKRRFLVSLGTWAVQPRGFPFGSADSPFPITTAKPLVKLKQGPIANLGPIVTALLTEGVARSAVGIGQSIGLDVASLLSNRKVIMPELEAWKQTVRFRIECPTGIGPNPAEGCTFEGWLVSRFLRIYSSTVKPLKWDEFLAHVKRDPEWTFYCIADTPMIGTLYELSFR